MSLKRLLVIDANPAVRVYIREVAIELGYDVVIAGSPAEFRRGYKAFSPTVIILGMVMPEEDGIDLIRFLGAEGCRARVLVTSAYQTTYLKAAQVLGYALGIPSIRTLTKPISREELRAFLAENDS